MRDQIISVAICLLRTMKEEKRQKKFAKRLSKVGPESATLATILSIPRFNNYGMVSATP